MGVKKFLSFISFVGVISFSLSNIVGAAGPSNEAPEFTKSPKNLRVGIVRNSERESAEDLKENDDLGKEGVKEQDLPDNQNSEIKKDASATNSDEKRNDTCKIALCTSLAIFTLLVLSVVLIAINSNSTEKKEVLYPAETNISYNNNFE